MKKEGAAQNELTTTKDGRSVDDDDDDDEPRTVQ